MMTRILKVTGLILLALQGGATFINVRRTDGKVGGYKFGDNASFDVREDSKSSTLICIQNFFPEDTAFRIYNPAEDDNVGNIMEQALSLGGKAGICEETPYFSTETAIECIDLLSKAKVSVPVNGDKGNAVILADQVPFNTECVGPAQPKEPRRDKNTAHKNYVDTDKGERIRQRR